MLKNTVLLLSLAVNIFFIAAGLINKPQKDTTPHIVMYGNSLTAAGNWKELLKRNDVQNSGQPGITTASMLKFIRPYVIDYHPRMCFLEGGINDIRNKIPLTQTFDNFKIIIDSLRFNKILPVIMLTFYINDTAINKSVDTLNTWLMDYAYKNGVNTIDMNPAFSSNRLIKPEMTSDGIHLTEQAYRLWRDQINARKFYHYY